MNDVFVDVQQHWSYYRLSKQKQKINTINDIIDLVSVCEDVIVDEESEEQVLTMIY
jgi:hypothetical protein